MAFWDIVAPIYDAFELLNKAHRQMIEKMNDLTPQGANVIELASGTGSISLAVSNKAKTVLCTDISDSMLGVAKRKAKRRGADNISFENVSIFETGKEDKSFDVVIASQVLHLLDEPQKACSEIKRITADRAFMTIPLLKNSTPFGRFLIQLYKIVGFKPKYELDIEDCKAFLEVIGFRKCDYYIIKGRVSLCTAVWRADNEN